MVICDDQSPDCTLEFVRQLARNDPRFRFIQNPRRLGLVANWNHCISQARGEWIKFVFQDDVILPQCLEKLIASCTALKKPLGFCERNFIFDDSVPQSIREWMAGHKLKLQSDYRTSGVITPEQTVQIILREPLLHNLAGEPTVTLIHRSLFQKLGLFDEALIQLCDAEFWCRVMILHGAAFVPEDLARFRIHSAAETTRNQNNRRFRKDTLDPLVIRYRFAFDSRYKPVRDPRITGKSIYATRRECALAAGCSWRQAKQTDAPGTAETGLIGDWESVIAHCPGLQPLASLGLAIESIGRIKRRFF